MKEWAREILGYDSVRQGDTSDEGEGQGDIGFKQ